MKTAISTACFLLKEETENALSLIKETGAGACSVMLNTFYEYRPEFAKRYAQNLGGAEVCSIETNAQNFEPQLFSPSRRIRGDGYYWLEQVMRSSQLFGAKRYILKAPAQDENYKFKERLPYLYAVYDFLAGSGIGLCIENSAYGLLNTPAQISEIKSVCPQICFSLNLKEAERSAHSYKTYLKETAGSLAQVVVGDVNADLIKQLKNIDFNGEIVIKTQTSDAMGQLTGLINKIKSKI